MDMLSRLIKLMQKKEDTKATLARNAGIPYTTIDGLFKRGCENVYISTARKLCDYYGVTLDYLVMGNDGLSVDALNVAAKYDRLDAYSREMVDWIVEHETNRPQQSSTHNVALTNKPHKKDEAWAQSNINKEATSIETENSEAGNN